MDTILIKSPWENGYQPQRRLINYGYHPYYIYWAN